MNFIAIPFQALVGLTIAILFTVVPGVSLIGYVVTSWIGEICVLSYFSSMLVLSSYRELILPATTSNPDVLSSYGNVTGEFNVNQIQRFAGQKFALLVVGIIVSIFFSSIGFRGFPNVVSWGLVLFYAMFTLGRVQGATAGFCWIFAAAAVVKGLDLMGVSSPVVAVLTCIGFACKDLPKDADDYDLTHNAVIAPRVIPFGVLAGIVPGLNASTILPLAFSRDLYLNSLLTTACAEGVSLGILVFQRGTSKTTVTTYLSSLMQGEQVNSVLLIAVVLLVGTYCCLSDRLWNFIDKSLAAEVEKPSWLDRSIGKIVPIVTALYFCAIPGNITLGIIVAAGLYCFGGLFADSIKAGMTPVESQKLVSAAPLIFRL